MKIVKLKKVIFLSLFLLLGTSTLIAQENVIKVNPMGLLYGSNLVGYEMSLGDRTSGLIGANISNYKFDGDFKNKSIGGELQFRYYFKESLNGFYGGLLGTIESGKTEHSTGKEKYNSFGAGGMLGYQWIWGSGFSLDLNAGVEHKWLKYKDILETKIDLKEKGMIPVLGISIGYAF